MVNFLIDQNNKNLAGEEYKHYFEKYDKMFIVGKDLDQREYDEGLAKFCKKNDCDLITKDGKAYIHFLAEKINTVQISELFYDEKGVCPIYTVKIID
jgi:hypothetical protein